MLHSRLIVDSQSQRIEAAQHPNRHASLCYVHPHWTMTCNIESQMPAPTPDQKPHNHDHVLVTCTCLHTKAPVRISYMRTEACLLEGAGRDVSQADRGGGQAALKRRTPIVTIAERLETEDPYPTSWLDLNEPRDGWF